LAKNFAYDVTLKCGFVKSKLNVPHFVPSLFVLLMCYFTLKQALIPVWF